MVRDGALAQNLPNSRDFSLPGSVPAPILYIDCDGVVSFPPSLRLSPDDPQPR